MEMMDLMRTKCPQYRIVKYRRGVMTMTVARRGDLTSRRKKTGYCPCPVGLLASHVLLVEYSRNDSFLPISSILSDLQHSQLSLRPAAEAESGDFIAGSCA